MSCPVAAEAMRSIGAKVGVRALAAALALLPLSALAQPGATIQRVPPAQSVERLNENLTRLSRQPTDIAALIGAGMAAYQLGDAQAANGFFLRADMVNPRLAQAKLGLALVALEMKQPAEAARNFDAAAELGEPALDYLSERALAYDLAGEQSKAQRDYAAALLRRPGDPTVIRNYAISLGISGKLTEAESMLRPLLYGSDRGPWRDRAMILAMNGHLAEARKIVQSGLPRPLADQIDPYLARIGALPPDRRAIAVHYGRFPADGLRLDPVTSPPPVRVAANEKDRKSRSRSRDDRDSDRSRARNDRRDSQPVRVASATQLATVPAPAAARPATAPAPAPVAMVQPAPVQPAASLTAAAAAPQSPASRPSAAVLNAPAATSPMTPPPSPVTTVQAPESAPQPGFSTAPVGPLASSYPLRSLAQIMADINVPAEERQPTEVPVDLTAVARLQEQQRRADQAAAAKAKREADAKARAKAEADAKAKAEAERKALLKANPSRNWVQIATGRDVAALAFDLRRLRRTYTALADVGGWTAEWGATRRLLVGPFSSAEKANALQSELRKAGADSFVWQSQAGEVVTALSRK